MAYLWALIYVFLGLAAALGHWAKKRYIDKVIRCGLLAYIKHDPPSTYRAVSAVIVAEISLAIGHVGSGLSLEQLVAAIGAGYMADSTLNKAPTDN